MSVASCGGPAGVYLNSVLTDASSILLGNRIKLLCSPVIKAWDFVLLFQALCELLGF